MREKMEIVEQLPISELYPFKNHPFKVVDDESMLRTVESVARFGVFSPVLVRPRTEGGYEIIAGHRRKRACEQAGFQVIPAIVREMDDDTATIMMVDSNLHREKILPSERAFAYKMKVDALKRKAGRPSKENSGQFDRNFYGKDSREIIAEQTGESARQVQRYINLTNLIPELLKMVDQKEIAFNPAVELSFLKESEQRVFLDAMNYSQSAPSLSQARRIKELSQKGLCTQTAMYEIMNEEKKVDATAITIKNDVLLKYFPRSYTPKQMQDTIIKLLAQWKKKRIRDQVR